jgi:hypothetical protein
MSATLKIAQCGNWRKSTTCPWNGDGSRNTRSVMLPTAPPNRKPNATAQPADPSRRENHTTAIATRIWIVLITGVKSDPRLNAAPGFRIRLNRRNVPITSTGSPGVRCRSASTLVS